MSDQRNRYAATPRNNTTTWGVGAAIVVALALGWYAFGHSSSGPSVASDESHPVTGMNSPAPTTPANPTTPAPVKPRT